MAIILQERSLGLVHRSDKVIDVTISTAVEKFGSREVEEFDNRFPLPTKSGIIRLV